MDGNEKDEINRETAKSFKEISLSLKKIELLLEKLVYSDDKLGVRISGEVKTNEQNICAHKILEKVRRKLRRRKKIAGQPTRNNSK